MSGEVAALVQHTDARETLLRVRKGAQTLHEVTEHGQVEMCGETDERVLSCTISKNTHTACDRTDGSDVFCLRIESRRESLGSCRMDQRILSHARIDDASSRLWVVIWCG